MLRNSAAVPGQIEFATDDRIAKLAPSSLAPLSCAVTSANPYLHFGIVGMLALRS